MHSNVKFIKWRCEGGRRAACILRKSAARESAGAANRRGRCRMTPAYLPTPHCTPHYHERNNVLINKSNARSFSKSAFTIHNIFYPCLATQLIFAVNRHCLSTQPATTHEKSTQFPAKSSTFGSCLDGDLRGACMRSIGSRFASDSK